MTVSTEKNRRFGYAGAPAQAGRRIRAVPLLAWDRERQILVMVNSARAGTRRYLPSSPFKPPPAAPPPEQYEVDDMVTHEKYGLGRVILVEGETAVVVDFAPRKVRILTPFARMVKL
jgi:hypothetical protein